MIAALILLAIVVLVVFWVIGAYNGLIGLKNKVANALEADRRAAQAPARPHPEPGQHGEGRDGFRAQHARGGDRGAEQGGERDGRGADRQGRGGADAGARPAVRADRGLPGAQGHRERGSSCRRS